MAIRLFNFTALCSAVLVGMIAITWFKVATDQPDPRKHFVSLSSKCHFSVSAWGNDAVAVIFDNPASGSYLDNMMLAISGPTGRSYPNVTVTGFGDFAGIYYRLIRWPDEGRSLWTLAISVRYPLILGSLLPLIWLVRNFRGQPGRGFPIEPIGNATKSPKSK